MPENQTSGRTVPRPGATAILLFLAFLALLVASLVAAVTADAISASTASGVVVGALVGSALAFASARRKLGRALAPDGAATRPVTDDASTLARLEPLDPPKR